MNKVEIIPAVLPRSFKDLQSHLSLMRGTIKRAQVDVVDGRFARAPGWRGTTWPYRDRSTFERIVAEEHGLPFWDEIDFQFDLMLEDPAPQVMDFVHAGASQIILHAKAKTTLEALQHLVDLRDDDVGTFSVRVGVAIGPTEQPEALEPYAAQFDFVQVMGIERIGRQGQPFDRRALYLVERLRNRYPQLPIQVDGGVNHETGPLLARAGATALVVGSAVFNSKDPVGAYKELYNRVNG